MLCRSLIVLFGTASMAAAELAEIGLPSLDRWMYGANATPGSRGQGSVFADPGDWGRLGQVMVGFDLAGDIPRGEAAERYQVSSVVLTMVTSGEPSFVYDSSYDPVASYLGMDQDAGRPIELHGVGYRDDYVGADFLLASTPLGPGNARNAFPLSWDLVGAAADVTRNVAEGFESEPWAIGAIPGVADGQLISGESDVVFSLDLGNSDVLGYVQAACASGDFYLMISSLQPAVQAGGTFVNFFMKESQEEVFFGGYAARLEIEYSIGDPPLEPLPALVIDTVAHAGGEMGIAWNQHAGVTYVVEAKAASGGWQAVQSETAVADDAGSYTTPITEGVLLLRVGRSRD